VKSNCHSKFNSLQPNFKQHDICFDWIFFKSKQFIKSYLMLACLYSKQKMLFFILLLSSWKCPNGLCCFDYSAISQQKETISTYLATNYLISFTQNDGMKLLLICLPEILHFFFERLAIGLFSQTFYKLFLCSVCYVEIFTLLLHFYFCFVFIFSSFHFHLMVHSHFIPFFVLCFSFHF
jgi:hypothetical protein